MTYIDVTDFSSNGIETLYVPDRADYGPHDPPDPRFDERVLHEWRDDSQWSLCGIPLSAFDPNYPRMQKVYPCYGCATLAAGERRAQEALGG